MTLRDIMTSNPKTVTPGASLQEAARLMRDFDTGAVPVVENGKPIGIITDRDIVVRAVAGGEAELGKSVRDFISRHVVTATPDMSTKEASDLMGRQQIRRLLVCEHERLVGIVSIGDLAVKEDHDERMGDTLQEISEPARRR